MRRRHLSQSLELPLSDRHEKETRQAWVYRCVRERIVAGELRRGDRLPSTRTLAERWGVSRGIVELAFEQLTLEGYVASRVGAGTEVVADLSCVVSPANAPDDASAPTGPRGPLPENAASLASKTGRSPDAALFSLPVWRKHMHRALRAVTPELLADTDPRGYLPLRASIARYVRMTRGIACEADEIVVTTGIRHAIDLVTEVLADESTAFYLEDPGYKNLSTLVRAPLQRCVSVPVDDEGFVVEAADRAGAGRSGIAYVTPAHQAPLGTTMSINRRMQLLEWAAARDVWIVEDDYDSEFSYGSAPLPALKAIDTQARVIHCSSFNKSLFPSLRIGYLLAPAALLARIAAQRSASGRANSLIEQMALASYIDAGDFARHLRASRSVYLRRRNLLLETLRTRLPKPCRLTGDHAGFHCVLWLPLPVDETALVATLREQGVFVEGLKEFTRAQTTPPALVLGYAALDDARLPEIATRIAAAIAAAAG